MPSEGLYRILGLERLTKLVDAGAGALQKRGETPSELRAFGEESGSDRQLMLRERDGRLWETGQLRADLRSYAEGRLRRISPLCRAMNEPLFSGTFDRGSPPSGRGSRWPGVSGAFIQIRDLSGPMGT